MNPLVSVVITTKNEEKNIENCIKSILEQSYKNIEIIVVDNFSSDRTKEIALKFTNNVYDQGPERSAQRNYGMIDKSSGEYVMFVDADMILSFNLIDCCVQRIEIENVFALWISEIVLGKHFFSKCRRFERNFYDGTVVDGARFFRKDKFVAVGGFDVNMSGPEDWDIDKKIGRDNIRLLGDCKQDLVLNRDWYFFDFIKERGADPNNHNAVIFHNESEFDLKKYLNKKSYYAKSFNNYIEKWGNNDQDIKKQLGFNYRYFGIFLEKGKWKKLLSHPFLAVGMYFLRGAVGVVYLFNRK
ncbi:MAG: glycosyltransferase [Patescibacteria group bacterium]